MSKLVRDNIPWIIEKNTGKKPKTVILNGVDYLDALCEKLKEECKEACESKTAEELADVIEVVFALGEVFGVSRKKLEDIRIEKAKKRGSFREKIKLL